MMIEEEESRQAGLVPARAGQEVMYRSGGRILYQKGSRGRSADRAAMASPVGPRWPAGTTGTWGCVRKGIAGPLVPEQDYRICRR